MTTEAPASNEAEAEAEAEKEKEVLIPVSIGTKRMYEVLILFDPTDATKDWDGLVATLTERITKREGEIVRTTQWAENKKLAYEVKGLRRGTYMSSYFYMEPHQIETLERNFRLDERVVRHLILAHPLLPNELKPKSMQEVEPVEEPRKNRRSWKRR